MPAVAPPAAPAATSPTAAAVPTVEEHLHHHVHLHARADSDVAAAAAAAETEAAIARTRAVLAELDGVRRRARCAERRLVLSLTVSSSSSKHRQQRRVVTRKMASLRSRSRYRSARAQVEPCAWLTAMANAERLGRRRFALATDRRAASPHAGAAARGGAHPARPSAPRARAARRGPGAALIAWQAGIAARRSRRARPDAGPRVVALRGTADREVFGAGVVSARDVLPNTSEAAPLGCRCKQLGNNCTWM